MAVCLAWRCSVAICGASSPGGADDVHLAVLRRQLRVMQRRRRAGEFQHRVGGVEQIARIRRRPARPGDRCRRERRHRGRWPTTRRARRRPPPGSAHSPPRRAPASVPCGRRSRPRRCAAPISAGCCRESGAEWPARRSCRRKPWRVTPLSWRISPWGPAAVLRQFGVGPGGGQPKTARTGGGRPKAASPSGLPRNPAPWKRSFPIAGCGSCPCRRRRTASADPAAAWSD